MSELTWIALLTAGIEAVTCFFRFVLGLQSTRDTGFLAPLTFHIRIHHGYIGALMLLLAPLVASWHGLGPWVSIVGWAMVLSDLIHHFLVLWPVTGHHEFHLRYPQTK